MSTIVSTDHNTINNSKAMAFAKCFYTQLAVKHVNKAYYNIFSLFFLGFEVYYFYPFHKN